MNGATFLCLVLLTGAILIGCASAPAAGDFTIEGRILDDGGAVYDNVELSLEDAAGRVVQTTQSGGGGTFSFPNLAPGNYRIVLDVENQPDGPLAAQPVEPIPVAVGRRPTETVRIRLVSRQDAAARVRRKYAADVSRWEAENTDPRNQGAVVFTGSSSIRLWASLAEDFPGIRVLNRGFGGSTAAELLQVLDVIVAVRPQAVVIYEGDNDLAPEGARVEDFLENMRQIGLRLEGLVRPDRILLLSIKPSRARAGRWPVFQEANRQLRRLAQDRGYTFVDVSSPMLRDGVLDERYIGRDGLHLSAEGYALWREVLEPRLRAVLR